MQIFDVDGQACLFGQDGSYGRMSSAHSAAEAPKERTSGSSSKKSSESKYVEFLSLDLTPGHGNLLGEFYWEVCSPWRIERSMLNTGVSPSVERESSLWLTLQDDVPLKYYLTKRSCKGILRRACERGKPLPLKLEIALRIQAGLLSTAYLYLLNLPDEDMMIAFAANQRDEVRDLHDIAGALSAQPGMKQQTFIAASFSAGAGASAGSIAYSEKCAPTLRGTASGNMMPSVMCLMDQGGRRMDFAENMTGTLRARMDGHQPLVLSEQVNKETKKQNFALFENYGIDSRYTGPHDVSPTITSRAGTGGNNLPILVDSRQRSDIPNECNAISDESALLNKAADDSISLPESTDATEENAPAVLLIRRLTPVECERLMGLEPNYTNVPGATDSKRYRALGNGVVIPCVEFIMRGIALAAGEPVTDTPSLKNEALSDAEAPNES